jgi:two-component system cell cycle sensor histidine kinase/response regulator CckA
VFSALPLTNGDGVVVNLLDVTERKRLDSARQQSEANLEAVLRSAPDIILNADRDLRITFINRTIAQFEAGAVVGTPLLDYVNPDQRKFVHDKLMLVIDHGETVSYETRGLDGVDPNHWSARAGPVLHDREVVGLTAVISNISAHKRDEQERERLRAELAEAHSLEALGRLAGGVAHDFNNLLTVVQGGVDLLRARLEGSSHAVLLEEIGAAATRASMLTRQLMAFGRQQTLEPRRMELNHVVSGIEEMIRRLIREDVTLVLDLAPDLGVVRADPVQIERVLLNLAANGRDAMAEGGTLTVKTANVDVGAHDERGAPPGGYVGVDVTDSGSGMAPETMARIFEPFFTTKGHEHGTGLGLASVHGIVAQSGGHIHVDSAPGKGTTFSILLPRVQAVASVRPPKPSRPAPPSGTGTVLLVEDNDSVRAVTRRILEAAGYRVWALDCPKAALEQFSAERLLSIDVLISDVVMPHMSGPKLAEALLERDPRLRVLFVSGHAQRQIELHGLSPATFAFLPKPFTAQSLTEQVRSLLRR